MEASSIKQFNEKLKALPEFVFEELNDFLDYLKYKSNNKEDWYEDLTDSHKKSIEKGLEDIKEGRVYSNEEAKQRIKDYLLEKSK